MGININEIYQTNIILNYTYVTYSLLSKFPPPNVFPVPLVSNLIIMPKLKHSLMRGYPSSLFQLHTSITSYYLKTGWVSHQKQLMHKSTFQVLTINQSRSWQSAWPLHRPAAQCLNPLCTINTGKCSSICLFCKKVNHKDRIIGNTKHLWYKSKRYSNI